MAIQIDGFSTYITFNNCSLTICQKTITPPEIDSGGSIDIGGMLPAARKYRLRAPKQLIQLNTMQITAAWDPLVYTQGMIAAAAVVGSNQSLTLTFANLDTLQFYGFVEKLTFQEVKEGEQPMVTLAITPTLWNGDFAASGCPIEVEPVFTRVDASTYRSC